MDKKICIITGANSGIGKEAAILIAKKDYHIVLACRDKTRGEAALAQVKRLSNSNNVELMIVDMCLQWSIFNFAQAFLKKYNRLDVIIHNAASFDISVKKPIITQEGIESIWATNHLGPVLLTQLLLNAIKNSPQGRILTIASKGLVTFPFLKVNINDPEFKNQKFSVVKAYYQSKLAQVMYTYWLSNQLKHTNITVNCIRVPNVKLDISRYPDISKSSKLMYSIKSSFSISAQQMAETYTYLTTSQSVCKVTGKYFDENNEIISSGNYSKDIKNINKVMEITLNYLKNY